MKTFELIKTAIIILIIGTFGIIIGIIQLILTKDKD